MAQTNAERLREIGFEATVIGKLAGKQNWAAEAQANLRRIADEIEEADREHFRQHLKNASEIVATWPEWKRKVLE